MNPAIKNVIELQTGKSVDKILNDIYESFSGEISDAEWTEKIRCELLDNVDLNDPAIVYAMAVKHQKEEKKKHGGALPGSDAQLDLSGLDKDWANSCGINLPDNMYVKWRDVNTEHVFHYLKNRQKHTADSVNSTSRAMEMFEGIQKHGNLEEFMRAKGVSGW